METQTASGIAVDQPPSLGDGIVGLRPWRDADVDQLVQACQDTEIQRYIPIPRPYRLDDAERYVARTRRQWQDGSVAAFAIVDAADDACVLGAIDLAVVGAVGTAAYWVVPGARGFGIATRALRLLVEWAFDTIRVGVVLLEIRPENHASLHVAHAAGFHDAGHIDLNAATGERDGLILVRLASAPRLM